MKIKEVEKKVGISAHSIRFYEDMGLIKIKRKEDSKYRDFSDEDIKKLKEIKLFRGLGISMEEIRRYYDKEISLQDMMNHQIMELKDQHNDMQRKEKLCEDIKDSNAPLISYTVDRYEDILQYKADKTPFEEAGTLLSSWNRQKHSKKKIILIELATFPLIWLFTTLLVAFMINIPHILEVKRFDIQYHWYIVLLSFLLSVIISWSDTMISSKFPNDLYEFHEKGIYYYDSKKYKYIHLLKAIWKNEIIHCYEFISYDDIEALKVWFHMVAKAPVNGSNAYQIDLFIYTKDDQCHRINTGLFGVSDEKIKLTVEILRENANKIIDPFHIIDHLDDAREDFYQYLDQCYRSKERQRINKS